jgi:hypothetical protein
MAKHLDSRFGKIKPFKTNPRTISDAAFTKLCQSIDRDPEFMVTRPIVIDEDNAILGGNQRQFAILSLNEGGWSEDAVERLKDYGWECVLEGRLPDEWVRRMVKPGSMSDEEWRDKKHRFVLVDNSPEGMAGEFDYAIMQEAFSIDVLKDAGIDFSQLDTGIQDDAFKSAEDKAEESEGYGEKDPKLKKYIADREKSREQLEDMTDATYYLCVIFQTTRQKQDFIKAAGLATDGEMFVSGLALAEKMGIPIERVEFKFPTARTDSRLSEMAMENEQEPTAPQDAGGDEDDVAEIADQLDGAEAQ